VSLPLLVMKAQVMKRRLMAEAGSVAATKTQNWTSRAAPSVWLQRAGAEEEAPWLAVVWVPLVSACDDTAVVAAAVSAAAALDSAVAQASQEARWSVMTAKRPQRKMNLGPGFLKRPITHRSSSVSYVRRAKKATKNEGAIGTHGGNAARLGRRRWTTSR
jgi:hypothetical protein